MTWPLLGKQQNRSTVSVRKEENAQWNLMVLCGKMQDQDESTTQQQQKQQPQKNKATDSNNNKIVRAEASENSTLNYIESRYWLACAKLVGVD